MITATYLQELGAPKAHFHCRLQIMKSHIRYLPRCVVHALQEPFRKELETQRTRDIGTTRGRQKSRMVQQLCHST